MCGQAGVDPWAARDSDWPGPAPPSACEGAAVMERLCEDENSAAAQCSGVQEEQGKVHHKAAGEQWLVYKYIFIDLFYYFFTLHNTGLCRSSAPALSCYLFRGQ